MSHIQMFKNLSVVSWRKSGRIILFFILLFLCQMGLAQTGADSLIERYKTVNGVRCMPMNKELMMGILSMAGENGVDKDRLDNMRKSFEAIDAMTTMIMQDCEQSIRDSFMVEFKRLPAHGYKLVAHQDEGESKGQLWQQVLLKDGKVAEFLFLSLNKNVLNFIQLKTHMTLDEFRRLTEKGGMPGL